LIDKIILEHATEGKYCYIAGWGMTKSGFLGSQPNKMKESGITVFGHEYCLANSYFENKDLNEEVEFWKVS